ncbi:hypothetical protein [Jiangella alba]|nr:hypothetical protein [Jiangella alba]
MNPPTDEGKRVEMAGKTPRGANTKKPAKLTLKEKRAAKREKSEGTPFIKPRKGATG